MRDRGNLRKRKPAEKRAWKLDGSGSEDIKTFLAEIVIIQIVEFV